MNKYYIQSIDPSDIASRFSTEDTLDPIHGMSEDWFLPRIDKVCSVLDKLPDREKDLINLYFFKNKKQTDIAEIFGLTQAAVSYRLKRALERIRFLVEMPNLSGNDIYLILEKCFPNEMDVSIFAEMFFSTCQSDVAERLGVTQGRVRHRYIKNLRHLGFVYLDQLYSWVDSLESLVVDTKDVRERLDLMTVGVQHMKDKDLEQRLLQTVVYLEELDLDDETAGNILTLAALYRVFVRIRYNFNILREVKLPKWSDRPIHSIT
jgi:predicted transcriptional regulator